MRQEAWEIHQLLVRAAIPRPVILVGHSVGGLIARVLVRDYPDDVAGVVMLDPTHENTRLSYRGRLVRVRDDATSRPVPPVSTRLSRAPPASAAQRKEFAELRRLMGQPVIQPPFDQLDQERQRWRRWAESDTVKRPALVESFWPEELRELAEQRRHSPHPLGARPLVVAAAGRTDMPSDLPRAERALWGALATEKREQKHDLASLSSNSLFVLDTLSGHHLQLDDPAVVVRSIRAVINAVRSPGPLPVRLP
jgi:pimeloyl-ACP methyl ester carboxylesterase